MPEIDFTSLVINVLSFQAGFNTAVVVAGATLLGIASGTTGVFALLRKRALMADALAHSALPGLGMAFIMGALYGSGGKQLWLLLLGATISGVCGVFFVQFLCRYTRLNEDTAIGAVLSCFFGAGIVIMSLIQSLGTGEEGGLSHFIYGQTAAMSRANAYHMFAVAMLSIVISIALLKEFRLICFDEEFAASEGWPVSGIDFAMMFLVVVITVTGLQSVGLLLIVAFLVIPPAAARFWTESLKKMVFCSAIIGGLSGYLGSSLSALLPRFPAGAVIVLVAGVLFFFSFFFAPNKGVLAILIRHMKLKLRICEDHLLRIMYEQCEYRDEISYGECCIREIDLLKYWSRSQKKLFFWWLGRQGIIKCDAGRVRFTASGLCKAKRQVRNHRLWEEYLFSHIGMPISHVDYSADLVEHILSPEVVAKLERELSVKLEGLPPKSLHPIGKG